MEIQKSCLSFDRKEESKKARQQASHQSLTTLNQKSNWYTEGTRLDSSRVTIKRNMRSYDLTIHQGSSI